MSSKRGIADNLSALIADLEAEQAEPAFIVSLVKRRLGMALGTTAPKPVVRRKRRAKPQPSSPAAAQGTEA